MGESSRTRNRYQTLPEEPVAVPVQVTKDPTAAGEFIEVDMPTTSLVWAFIVDK
jgi:predicted short-subunit dehydrogenase-like oxidoreductase (DUF2520 family)